MALPQLGSRLFLTDGGLETTLIFHNGLELPCFASFTLLRTPEGRKSLRDYFLPYIETARQARMGFVLEAPTWRANPDWGTKLGCSPKELAKANREAIELLAELRFAHEAAETPMVISGNIGPRGDGYVAGAEMTPEAAAAYHGEQIAVFAGTDDRPAAGRLAESPTGVQEEQARRAEHWALARKLNLVTQPRVVPFALPLDDARIGLLERFALSDAGAVWFRELADDTLRLLNQGYLEVDETRWQAFRVGGPRPRLSELITGQLSEAGQFAQVHTPEQIAKTKASHTGRYLKPVLKR